MSYKLSPLHAANAETLINRHSCRMLARPLLSSLLSQLTFYSALDMLLKLSGILLATAVFAPKHGSVASRRSGATSYVTTRPSVATSDGTIWVGISAMSLDSFKGIPYAQPPIGFVPSIILKLQGRGLKGCCSKLRFAAPLSPANGFGVSRQFPPKYYLD